MGFKGMAAGALDEVFGAGVGAAEASRARPVIGVGRDAWLAVGVVTAVAVDT